MDDGATYIFLVAIPLWNTTHYYAYHLARVWVVKVVAQLCPAMDQDMPNEARLKPIYLSLIHI